MTSVKRAPMDAREIVRRLRLRYAGEEWITFQELRPGAGFISYGWIDFAAVNAWGRGRRCLVAVEVKVDRADWRRELANPEKSAFWTGGVASEFWVAAPHGVVPVEELPAGWGLLEAVGAADTLRKARAAVPNATATIPDSTWVMMLRDVRERAARLQEQLGHFAKFAGREISLTDLDTLAQHRHCRTCLNGIERAADRKNTERRRQAKANFEWVAVERRWRDWINRALGGWSDNRTPDDAYRLMGQLAELVRALPSLRENINGACEALLSACKVAQEEGQA